MSRSAIWIVYGAAAGGLAVPAGFAVLAAVTWENERPYGVADWFGSVALLAAFTTPALLALLATRGRRELLLASALLSCFLSFTALSGVTLVLLLPGVGYAVAYALSRRPAGAPRLRPLLLAFALAGAGAGAFLALFAQNNVVCWKYKVRADGTRTVSTVPPGAAGSHVLRPGELRAGGGCDDARVPLESGLSVALTALALSAGAMLGKRRAPSPLG